MNRRQALRSLTSVSIGGSAASMLASCDAGAAELPLRNILQRTRVLAESIVKESGNRDFAVRTTLHRCANETADLCMTALARLGHGRSSSPAFWQSCADSAARSSSAWLTSYRQTEGIPVARTNDAAEFSQLARILHREAARRAFAVWL